MRRKQLGRHTKEMLRVTCRKVQGFKYTADKGLAPKKKVWLKENSLDVCS